MRIAPLTPDQLREALDSDAPGAAAEGWRLLREDVRALAPPLDPGFEHRLHERLRGDAPASASRTGRPAARRPRPGRLGALSSPLARHKLASGAAAAACVLIVALLAAGTFGGGHAGDAPPQQMTPRGAVDAESAAAVATKHSLRADDAPASNSSEGAPFPHETSTGTRVQEQAASITLSTPASEVQSVAGAVGRVAGTDGGYVISSQVNVQRERTGSGEATLSLSIPSARLAQALTALGRLAPIRAQSQSLQDITGAYEEARRTLADAAAERAALLRALAKASTQGQIESLRQRLSLAGGAIARDKSRLQSVSRRAESSRVEVSVLASAHGRDTGSTLSRGVDDAGHVLAVVLVVLLIALAVLVPAAAVAALVLLGTRRWRRLRREHALDGA